MLPKVKVQVQEIRRGGLVVTILGEDRSGLIPRRELTWDRSTNVSLPKFQAGDQIEAVILSEKGSRLLLSLRRLQDPWAESRGLLKIGQVVRGEVVNVRRDFGAFVQIREGIVALAWPADIPLLRNQSVEEVLAIGDQVQAVITDVDMASERITISLTRRWQELDHAPLPKRKAALLDLLRDRADESLHDGSIPAPESPRSRRYRPPIDKLQRIIVVDEHKTEANDICQALLEEFGAETDHASSRLEALNMVQRNLPYDLAVIDAQPADESAGITAEELLGENPRLAIIFVSADPLTELEIPAVGNRHFPFALNTAEEIIPWVNKLCTGYWEESLESDGPTAKGSGGFLEQLGVAAFARRPLPEVLQQMLQELREKTGVAQALVVKADLLKQRVSILAADPPIDGESRKVSEDGLWYSPVHNVIEEEEEFTATNILPDQDRFKNLFPTLDFTSCLGLPLTIPDIGTQHALFLLHTEGKGLSFSAVEQARLAASMFAVALERAQLLDLMRRYEQRYTLGHLLSSMVHELSNKIDGFSSQVNSLPEILAHARAASSLDEQRRHLYDAAETAQEIVRAQQELRELVQSYQRVSRGEMEPVAVNTIVEKVCQQLASLARESKVEIEVIPGDDLPPALVVPSRLEQIITNLLLNGIQQVARQRRVMARIVADQDQPMPSPATGIVIVQTHYEEAAAKRPIRVRVTDSGPGISYHAQRRIFQLDRSTRRRGHGLGLFISQSMAATMGGRLRLANSVMFLGSTFVVELPVASTAGRT